MLVVGGTSGIGRAVAARLARSGAQIHLSGRNSNELERVALDLSIRLQTTITWSRFEASDFESHTEFFADAVEQLGGLDTIVVCIGELGEQKQAEADLARTMRIIDSNYTGPVSLLNLAANHLERQRSGTIIGISSVAGDRGRQSNYLYGSAKSGFSTYLSGLRSRLAKNGVHVLTVKPGFVDTKMSFGKPGMFLVASPEDVAVEIVRSARQRRDIVYVPWFWALIMLIIKLVPETIFKRTKL